MTNDQKELFNNMITGKILIDEPMQKHTTFGIGGPVSALIYPKDKNELKMVLIKVKQKCQKHHYSCKNQYLLYNKFFLCRNRNEFTC